MKEAMAQIRPKRPASKGVSGPTSKAPTNASLKLAPTDTGVIVTQIARAIAAHKLPAGAKLGEEALGEIFGVSRTKIRQALFQLTSDKFITMIPGRGAFVAQPTVREAREVFEARRMVEAAVLTTFIERASARDIAALKSHLAEQQRAADTGSVQTRNRLLGDFHTVIARLTGNTVMTGIVEELVSRTSLITLLYQNTRGAVESLDDHHALMAAIERRDARQAIKLMTAHLNGVEKGLVLREESPRTADLKSALG